MDDKPNEGNLNAGGEQNADSTSSQGQGQPLEANLAKTIASLQKKIDAQDGEIRALKSGKDKAVDRVEKSQEELLAKLARYLDVDEDKVREAQRQSVLDDLVAERLGGVPTAPSIQGRVEEAVVSAGSRSDFAVADAIAEVEGYHLSPNDSDFITLLRDKNLTKEKVKDYILGKVKPQKPVSEAGVIQPAATGGVQGKSDDALIMEYRNRMMKARGNPGELRAIKNEYIQKGVPVDSVIFS